MEHVSLSPLHQALGNPLSTLCFWESASIKFLKSGIMQYLSFVPTGVLRIHPCTHTWQGSLFPFCWGRQTSAHLFPEVQPSSVYSFRNRPSSPFSGLMSAHCQEITISSVVHNFSSIPRDASISGQYFILTWIN